MSFCLSASLMQAQITIGGNIYGGGNEGDTGGSTTVTVRAGDINGVFGGARMAEVEGSAFVHIDGEHAADSILINRVYGGNDIAGSIGSSESLPTELKHAEVNKVDKTWNAFVRISAKTIEDANRKLVEVEKAPKIYIGQLFGGGNGDYDYISADSPYKGKLRPDLGKTYLEVVGGSIVYAYGGGNNATVTKDAVICVDNPSKVVNSMLDKDGKEMLTDARFKAMGINTTFSYPSSDAFQIGRFFGGNNKAEMAIRPKWDLRSGKIRNLYSGGNQGAMTCPDGLFLNIESTSTIIVDNLYGGCRMADVIPTVNGAYKPVTTAIEGYNFPEGFSAHVVISGGDVNNVYGGNDISGKVYGGNAIGIRASVRGDVYGGGNGSYPYTDNAAFKNSEIYGDLYYEKGSNSVEALNAFRPNAEQVSIRVVGTKAKPTIIHGGIYCGGNSATIMTDMLNPKVELKIGSYVYADSVFLGNNGANMVKKDVLEHYAGSVDAGGEVLKDAAGKLLTSGTGTDFSSLDLTNAETFDTYMDAVAMRLMPSVVFDGDIASDADVYEPYTSYFGSFFCGGNVGSMKVPGMTTITFNRPFYIYNKLVGGCNNANIYAQAGLNAQYLGGLLEDPDKNGNKLTLNLNGPKLMPMRWNANRTALEFNTVSASTGEEVAPVTSGSGAAVEADFDRRLLGANIYGGCYNSGHVNGNVVININGTLVERDKVFDLTDEVDRLYDNLEKYNIIERRSGVSLSQQGMDVLGSALNVFGGGYGVLSEIWGSTTINLNKGYTFQIFGGGEAGAIGKAIGWDAEKGKAIYDYNEAHSTYINLGNTQSKPGVARGAAGDSSEMAECEFIYGGGFEGLIAGSTHVNLGNGRIFNSFAGSCNADIIGHTETCVGQHGFPYIRDHIYGGNDLGGEIIGSMDFSDRVSDNAKSLSYDTSLMTAHAYMEYNRGRVENIFGGCYGDYDYINEYKTEDGYTLPRLENTFVYFHPLSNTDNYVEKIFGAGQGATEDRNGDNIQDYSYVLIDSPQNMDNFAKMEVFGAGANNGIGMRTLVDPAKASDSEEDHASAIIDLVSGQINTAYGGSFNEGNTRRTMVNVPEGSTISLSKIFGGAYGNSTLLPCDVYEANVNYRSGDAQVSALYGGNNSERRTVFGKVNVSSPVWSNKAKGYQATVYGAGCGANTWAEYTEVNLEDGAVVYQTYGGGENGKVFNAESVQAYKELSTTIPASAWSLGAYYDGNTDYAQNDLTKLTLSNPLVRKADMDDRADKTYTYNTNVLVNQGATVTGYAYGGGKGAEAVISGTTYIGVLGGTVAKDVYAAGEGGPVEDMVGAKNFIASSNAYIKGGTVRNVYGGGWEGHVGYHEGVVSASNANDRDAEDHVVVGVFGDDNFLTGAPAVTRNVYGGGEGGSVFGKAYVTINNGHIGYRYQDGEYVEELDDATAGDNMLDKGGNVFGGGYVANSYTDFSDIKMYSGTVRGCLYGGGEIGPIGRGSVADNAAGGIDTNGSAKIYKYGSSTINMYGGHVNRNVFGGGRGFDNWGGDGTKYMSAEVKKTIDLSSKGYIFGTTDVNIHGGEIGTLAGVVKDHGNVFGGGDHGFVYGQGKKASDGYYHETSNVSSPLTEDCRVNVEACGYALKDMSVGGTAFKKGDPIPNAILNTLTNGSSEWNDIDQKGITIYNGVFAGGNVTTGSSEVFAFSKTIFGNATAAVVDVFCRDLISVGGDGVGGIYGDGNLTYVDGYRELNISNYGTDFYALPSSMDLTDPTTLDKYNRLTDRQKAIYVVKYKFDGAAEGNVRDLYEAGDVILSDEYNKLTDVQKKHWTAVHSVINEGRYINTVQRCDFCGIIGSRLVLRGAMDRAQENSVDDADYTNYTINRVGELSLNQWHSKGEGVAGDEVHGCYFGIYNVVKLLGAVTSDVRFDDVRETTSTLEINKPTGGTYWDWKQAKKDDNNVNNGSSYNKIALASGVYLDIVKEIKDDGSKVYGPITGVVELDLLNVTPGEGGGYVYAENIHGVRKTDEVKAIAHVLSEANKAQGGCRTNAGDTYSAPGTNDELETSGNFVSSLKNIVDDCFPVSNSWMPGGAPAHYWYIRGEFYVYDQEVSAYTGSADAYSAEISIPLTMVAQSNARLRILNVLPGLYADPTQFDPDKSYYDADLGTWKSDSLEIAYDNVTKKFGQNDPISYWDWYMTNKGNQSRFVTMTYSCIDQVTVNGKTYYPGQGILPDTYESLAGVAGTDAYGNKVENAQQKFCVTNGMSKENGFVLTLDMTNPSKWNDYYTALNNNKKKISTTEWNNMTDAQKKEYIESATFRCNASGTYGQYYFNEGDITSQAVYEMETTDVTSHASNTQAKFETAYIAVDSCEVTIGGEPRIMQKNATIPASTYNALTAAEKSHFSLAKVCGSTFSASEKELYVVGQVVPANSTITTGAYASNFTNAWYCTGEGSWGGQFYEEGQNYSGVNYCQLLPEERHHFSYNYDALDLLIADFTQNGETYPTKEELAHAGTDRNNHMPLYDGTNEVKLYSVPAHIDYDAIYRGTSGFTYKPDNGNPVKVTNGTKLVSVDYQNLPNDYTHFSTISVNDNHKQADGSYKTYVVWNTFDVGGKMYNAGKTITQEEYDGLGQLQENVDVVTMTAAQYGNNTTGLFFYCIDEYEVGAKDKYVEGYTSSTLYDIDNEEYAKGSTVPVGTIISQSKMNPINYQKDFEVSGEIPMEQTMLYVPVTADYNELQKDRYITVIFEYTYTESDAQGLNFETRVEKHILNLRVKFKSGKPIIGKLKEPPYVLPLETVEIGIPFIQENASAFPILKGGFEIYDNETDALKHRNGREFVSSVDPVYFYEDMSYVAYYAESRLGRTYSDPVPIHVANYQRMSDVINDPEHMYINHRLVKRNPKIYIDDRKVDGQTYNELDAMKELFDIVNGDYGRVADDNTEKNHGRDVIGAKGLDFFVQNNIAATRPWTSIGDAKNCFQGNFHGNGHTLSNMSNSLFGSLCGNVYNIGVMGTFTSGGVADTGGGRIENAWVSTEAAPTGKAVMANPTDAVILNSYYPETQAFTAHGDGVEVTKRPVGDFTNGRVAYDLNRYYLEARYNLFTKDENVNGNPVKTDSALYRMPDGTIEHTTTKDGDTWPITHGLFYTSDYAWHTGVGAGNTEKKYGYVESLYEDGDFRFADGLKPQTADMRLTQYSGYMPVFPDDYIFFGQRLAYGLYGNRTHDVVPMGAVKEHTVTTASDAVDNSQSGLLTDDVETENRVYRAPAYFQDGKLGKTAMYNANAAFAATYGDKDVYKNLTAIDFSGGNGDTHGSQGVVPGAEADFTDRAHGYGPLLDFVRLDNFRTGGVTQNLLAYAPDSTLANTKNLETARVLKNWSSDIAYAEGTDPAAYRTVAIADALDVKSVKGHVVVKSGNAYTSIGDQYLVDKQDFNAPIAYAMTEGKRMWYQRQPDNYVELDKGWEAVSLPFSAELVTTQDKGEITHFYNSSETGHEYWLRGYQGGAVSTTDAKTFIATMSKPGVGTEDKAYTNTFLWDYYYSKDDSKDKNEDKYQKEYYRDSHTLYNYPNLQNGSPYIIGFPGKRYYEFDLSGQWTPKYRYLDATIANPGKQTVTFASAEGAKVGVSDAELSEGSAKASGYTFLPNYMTKTVEAEAGYLLNGAGDSFVKNAAAVVTVPFRPYFVTAAAGDRTRGVVEQIIFGQGDSNITEERGDPRGDIYGTLKITAKRHQIVVESSLSYETEVSIYTPAGIALKTFTIKPDETIETYIVNQGVYIVQSADGRYTKKLTLR